MFSRREMKDLLEENMWEDISKDYMGEDLFVEGNKQGAVSKVKFF